MADVFLVPMAKSMLRWGTDLKNFPKINSLVTELCKLEAFAKAEPENQPDAEKK